MEEDTKLDIQKSINQVRDIIDLLDYDIKINLPYNVKEFFTCQYDESVEYLRINCDEPLKKQAMEKYTPEIMSYLMDKYIKFGTAKG